MDAKELIANANEVADRLEASSDFWPANDIRFDAFRLLRKLIAALAHSDAVQAPVAWRYRAFSPFARENGSYAQSEKWQLMHAPDQRDAHSAIQGAIVEPLYAAPVASAAAEWQPIETVPKDGTEVALLFAADIEILGEIHPRVRAASWRGDWSIPYSRNNPPTHWAHLPAAPQGAAQ